VEPGLSNVLARYAEKNLFGELDEVSTKDGSSLEVCSLPLNRNPKPLTLISYPA
jgi:hypothetical protein